MPASLLPRLEQWLAMAGMRVYAAQCKDGTAYLVGADNPAERTPGPWTVQEIIDGYDDAVAYLAEQRQDQDRTPARRKTRRKRDSE